MNAYAKFYEIPSMILEVIKETKCYGHTDGRSVGRTFGQRENSIPSHKHSLKIGMCLQGLMKFHQCLFKILRKLSMQKPLRITKGNNSNKYWPLALRFFLLVFVLKIGMCLQGLMKFHQ